MAFIDEFLLSEEEMRRRAATPRPGGGAETVQKASLRG
jgi:hypothetical protein